MPKVSVIIPVYNVEKYLRDALQSVVSQTLSDIEIILINNGASNICKKIINEFATKYNQIRVINFEENQGYGKAINTGLNATTGEYISFVDSDDVIEPNMMEILYNLAKNNDADIAKSSFLAFDEKGYNNISLEDINVPIEKTFTVKENSELLREHPSIWAGLYKRSFLENNNIKFFEYKGGAWVDNAFQVQTFLKANSIIFTNKILYRYRINRLGSSSSMKNGFDVIQNACTDVNKILVKNAVTNEDILKNIYIRYLNYVRLMEHKLTLFNFLSAVAISRKILSLSKVDILPVEYQKYYAILSSNRVYTHFICKYLNNLRKKIISIKFNHKEKNFYILGKFYNFNWTDRRG